MQRFLALIHQTVSCKKTYTIFKSLVRIVNDEVSSEEGKKVRKWKKMNIEYRTLNVECRRADAGFF